MPNIMCAAITCIHNAGNFNGKVPEMGSFLCHADKVELKCKDMESECIKCGYKQFLEQTIDCETYKRCVGEEI